MRPFQGKITAMKAAPFRLSATLILILTTILLGTGCHGAVNTPETLQSVDASSTQAGTPIEPAFIPTDTPSPALVWLVIKPDDGEHYLEQISVRLRDLAARSGYGFRETESLADNDLQDAKAVFWYGDPADIQPLAASAPQVPFVLISTATIEPAANLSQVHLSAARVSFIAGLTAILIAPDRRAGGLFPAEDPLSAQRIDAFNNGARYLCGRCVPVYAPVVFFPLTGSVSGGQGFEAWKAAFDELDQSRIESLYLTPEAASWEMLDYLDSQGVVVVGTAAPSEGYASLWAATVIQDPAAALENLWPQLLETEAPSRVVNAPIILQDVNELILTPGRRGLVEKIAAELTAGWIEPLSVP